MVSQVSAGRLPRTGAVADEIFAVWLVNSQEFS